MIAKLISAVMLLFLFSCGVGNSFNKQKFTNLKPLKQEPMQSTENTFSTELEELSPANFETAHIEYGLDVTEDKVEEIIKADEIAHVKKVLKSENLSLILKNGYKRNNLRRSFRSDFISNKVKHFRSRGGNGNLYILFLIFGFLFGLAGVICAIYAWLLSFGGGVISLFMILGLVFSILGIGLGIASLFMVDDGILYFVARRIIEMSGSGLLLIILLFLIL